MKIEKKYVIATLLAVGVSVFASAAYLQYKRMMDYVIGFKKVTIKKINQTILDFDLFLNFENKSNVTFTIIKQKYDVYINNVLVAKLEGNKPSIIAGNSTNELVINVNVNPKAVFDKIGKSILEIIASPEKTIIKIDIKLQVKLWGVTINIPYVFENSLKNMMEKGEKS